MRAATEETAFQRERRERAEQRAERLRRQAGVAHQAARAEVEHIPIGQPILVGHHSERKHRRALERHDAKMRKGAALDAAAREAEGAAALAGRAIVADDPEAIDALQRKLAALEASLASAKALNKIYRATKRAAAQAGGKPDYAAAFAASGLAPELIRAALRTLDLCPWVDAPADTKNTAASIRRVKARIEELEAEAERSAAEPIRGDGFEVEEDVAGCRIRIRFDARTSPEVHQLLRREGFVFSRREGAYQRKLNANGRAAARRIANVLGGAAPPSSLDSDRRRFRLDELGRLFTLEELLEKAGPEHADDAELLGDLIPDDVASAIRGMRPGDRTDLDLGASGVYRIECVDPGPTLTEVLRSLGFEHRRTERSALLGLGSHDILRIDTGEVVFTGTACAVDEWLRESGLLSPTTASEGAAA